MQALSSAVGYQNELVRAIVANDRFLRRCEELHSTGEPEISQRRAALEAQRTKYRPDELLLLEDLEKKVCKARPQQRVDRLRMVLQIELNGELAAITQEVARREPNYLMRLKEKKSIMQKVVRFDMALLEQLFEPMKTHNVALLHILAEASESKELQTLAFFFEQASSEDKEDLAKETLVAIESRKGVVAGVDDRQFGLESYFVQYIKKALNEKIFPLYETMLYTLPEGYQEEEVDRQARLRKMSPEELATSDYLRREIARKASIGFSQRFMASDHLTHDQKNDSEIGKRNNYLIRQAIDISVSESIGEVTGTIRAIYPEFLLQLLRERESLIHTTELYNQSLRKLLTFSEEVLTKLQVCLQTGWYRDLDKVVEAEEFRQFIHEAPRNLRTGLMNEASRAISKELERRKKTLGVLFYRLEKIFEAECSQDGLVEKWKQLLKQGEPTLESTLSEEESRILTIFACLFYLCHFGEMQAAIVAEDKANSWVKCTGVIICEIFHNKAKSILADLSNLLSIVSLQEIENKIYEEIEFLENLQNQSQERLLELLLLLEQDDERLIAIYLQKKRCQQDEFLKSLANFLENGTDFFEKQLLASLRLLVVRDVP